MKTITILLMILTITSALSQDLSGVWHGNPKTPDNKDVLFVFFFEKDGGAYTTTMAIPNFRTERDLSSKRERIINAVEV